MSVSESPQNSPPPAAPEKAEFITVRLPLDLAEFVNALAGTMCNSRAGVIRYALTQLREASASAEKEVQP